MTLLQDIKTITHQAFADAFPGQVFREADIEVAATKDAKLGDYQCNSAMRFTKVLGQTPRAVAEQVVECLRKHSLFSQVTVAGPGFINLKIAPDFLESEVARMLAEPAFGLKVKQPIKVIVDFSSPNVAKEMHVGHLRSTIIGDCLARVFEFLGDEVLRLNHIGDWGTAFGMLISHMELVALDVLEGKRNATLIDLMNWYRESKKRFDEDEAFRKAAQLKVVALQSGDAAALKAWHIICEISEAAYQEIYDLLDVKITARGESFYNPYLKQTIQDLTKKALVHTSEGAQCIFLEGFVGKEGEPLPLIVQKSDGGYGYASTDMAAIWHRTQIEKGERLIYVTDGGQGSHFAMIFAAAAKAGYIKDMSVAQHVPFGLVLGPDGKKFKTRSGATEKLIDLLNTAIAEARSILQERGTPADEIEAMAQVLGINAVKYADLSCNRVQDYQFSYERMLKFEGNTAAFIMYSLVRVLSIQRKVGGARGVPSSCDREASHRIQSGGHLRLDPEASLRESQDDDQAAAASLHLQHPSELALALHLARFGDTIEYVARELYPHRLTDYLYELANHFNAFFRDCRVEGVPEQESRLILCELTARVFKTGMHLLGLKHLDKM